MAAPDVKGIEFEGDFPLTVNPDSRKLIALLGIEFEGDFPAPGGGIEAGIFSNA